jgi:acyl carrier protein
VPSLQRISAAVIEKVENKLIETTDIAQQIKCILEDMQLNIVPEEIPDNYSLLEGGLALDSILIAELIARIEDRFELHFDDRVLDIELFNNLTLLASFVAQERLTAQCNPGNSQS